MALLRQPPEITALSLVFAPLPDTAAYYKAAGSEKVKKKKGIGRNGTTLLVSRVVETGCPATPRGKRFPVVSVQHKAELPHLRPIEIPFIGVTPQVVKNAVARVPECGETSYFSCALDSSYISSCVLMQNVT